MGAPVESPAAVADTSSMADPTWRPLGEILIERGLLDRVQLEHWLMQQRLSGMLLGELLVMHRVLSPVDVAAALAVQRGAEDVVGGVTSGSRQLGRILVEQDLLTESGLQRALLAQKRLGGNLGDILIERGYVSRQQIEETLADQDSRERADLIPIQSNVEARKEHYEVPGSSVTEPLHVSDSFLDATDFAFDLIERDDPHEVEIVRVREDERESVWSYSREASERYRDETRGIA